MSLLFSLAFLFNPPPPHTHVIELEDLDERARVTSCLRERFLFFLTMFWSSVPGAGVYRLVCNHLNVAARVPPGCLFVLSFIMPFFFNCHCGKTGMCHCSLLAAGVRKPNYHGSQCLVVVVV